MIIFVEFTLVYIFFYSYWEELINNQIIDKFLNRFETNLLNDILFFVAVGLCMIHTLIFRGIKIKWRTIIICIIVIAFWLYYRWCSDSFDLKPLFSCHWIYYFDIVLVIALSKLLCLCGLKKTVFEYHDGFYKDTPINTAKEDNLGRAEFAQEVMDRILETDTSKGSFSFGIDSLWGAGKTSFMNLMKEWIECSCKNECIVIDFNPWLYSGEKNLVSIFFDELSKSVKNYDYNLADNIIDYSKALSAFNTNETKIISSLIDLTNEKRQLQDRIKRIEDSISYINKKIIVFIDDIDRLDPEELVQMLKLVRNISDFPHMYFIIAYDKNYIINCLKKRMPTKETEFAEKIFQVEFHLPLHISQKTKEIFLNHILKNIVEKDRREIQTFINRNDDKSFPVSTLTSLRVINRLSNSFKTSYAILKGSVNVCDLILLELLKTKYPTVFTLFELKRNEILVDDGMNTLKVFRKDTNYNRKLSREFDLIDYIEKNSDDLCLNKIDIDSIKVILSLLFPGDQTGQESNRHIYNKDCMNRYFNISVPSEISEHEFHDLMLKPIEEIKPKIDIWAGNNLSSLITKINQYKTNDINQHLKLIDLLFYLLSLDPHIMPNVIEINERMLSYKPTSDEDRKVIKQYIKDAIVNYGYNKGVGKYLFWQNLKQTGADLFNKAEFNDLRIKLLSDCIHNEKSVDIVFDCFVSMIIANDENGTDFQCLRRNQELMKEYVSNHLVDFIKRIIVSSTLGNKYKVDSNIRFLWRMDDFIQFIKNIISEMKDIDNDDSIIIKDFHDFLIKYKNSNYEGYIDYDFSFSIYHNKEVSVSEENMANGSEELETRKEKLEERCEEWLKAGIE